MPDFKITVLINTYNWPQALKAQLLALNKGHAMPDEVIIADDGSQDATQQMIALLSPQLNFPVKHLWQQDKGFRVAQARNKGIFQATGNYIIFLDHDYIVRRDFISNHYKLAEPGYFVSGSRILLNEAMTQRVLDDNIDLSNKSFWWFFTNKFAKNCNRCLCSLRFPLGLPLRKIRRHSWKSTRNLIAVWREDLLAVNGYDHSFEGWGYEDSDLVIRLLHHGVKRKLGKFSTEVMHLNHPIARRSAAKNNYQRLMDTLQAKRPIQTAQGINQLID